MSCTSLEDNKVFSSLTFSNKNRKKQGHFQLFSSKCWRILLRYSSNEQCNTSKKLASLEAFLSNIDFCFPIFQKALSMWHSQSPSASQVAHGWTRRSYTTRYSPTWVKGTQPRLACSHVHVTACTCSRGTQWVAQITTTVLLTSTRTAWSHWWLIQRKRVDRPMRSPVTRQYFN